MFIANSMRLKLIFWKKAWFLNQKNDFAKLIFALPLDKQQMVAIMKMIPYKERASLRFHYKNVEEESASLLLTPFTSKNRYALTWIWVVASLLFPILLMIFLTVHTKSCLNDSLESCHDCCHDSNRTVRLSLYKSINGFCTKYPCWKCASPCSL